MVVQDPLVQQLYEKLGTFWAPRPPSKKDVELPVDVVAREDKDGSEGSPDSAHSPQDLMADAGDAVRDERLREASLRGLRISLLRNPQLLRSLL